MLLLFVGRIQPLKAPDVLVKAAAELVRRRPDLRSRLVVGILGGASGTGVRNPMGLTELAEQRGIADLVRFVPPVDRPTLAQWYRAADVLAVPSHNESFGLVAVEAQACGTPVVAANVGGLPTAVGPRRRPRRRARHRRLGHRDRRRSCSTPSAGPGCPAPPPSTPPGSAGRAPPSGSRRSTPTRWPAPARRRSTTPRRSPASRTAVIP